MRIFLLQPPSLCPELYAQVVLTDYSDRALVDNMGASRRTERRARRWRCEGCGARYVWGRTVEPFLELLSPVPRST